MICQIEKDLKRNIDEPEKIKEIAQEMGKVWPLA